jgi:hypothetical protein
VNQIKDPREVQEMREQLAEARRAARGVKESARGLRILRGPKSAEIAAPDIEHYDSTHPAPANDETTRRVR